jgi:hypothetical protein
MQNLTTNLSAIPKQEIGSLVPRFGPLQLTAAAEAGNHRTSMSVLLPESTKQSLLSSLESFEAREVKQIISGAA